MWGAAKVVNHDQVELAVLGRGIGNKSVYLVFEDLEPRFDERPISARFTPFPPLRVEIILVDRWMCEDLNFGGY